MNSTESSQRTADPADDAPTASTTIAQTSAPAPATRSMLSTLPASLANSPYALFLAEQCDRYKADLQRERDAHKVTRERRDEAVTANIRQFAELVDVHMRATRHPALVWGALLVLAVIVIAIVILAGA